MARVLALLASFACLAKLSWIKKLEAALISTTASVSRTCLLLIIFHSHCSCSLVLIQPPGASSIVSTPHSVFLPGSQMRELAFLCSGQLDLPWQPSIKIVQACLRLFLISVSL